MNSTKWFGVSSKVVLLFHKLVSDKVGHTYRPQRPQAYLLGASMAGFSSVMSERERADWSIREGKNGPSPGKKSLIQRHVY